MKFSEFWGAELDPNAGLTVVEVMNAAHEGQVKGMYIMGENPAMSDPNLRHVREALASLDHLVMQELFLTETAWHADVVLPASAWPEKDGTVTNTNRQVQMGRVALTDARRRPAGLVDHPGNRAPHRARLELWRPGRCLRRDGGLHALARQHQLGEAASRRRRHLPLRAARTSPART